jgi:thioredoxin 1
VNEDWVKKESLQARDNPVDQARLSGRPSLVDFGATGCGPCDRMTPILDKLKRKYSGKLNVLFIHVHEEKILSIRYGIRSIPIQIFFDKTGKEVYRHIGFFPEAEIEKKLAPLL